MCVNYCEQRITFLCENMRVVGRDGIEILRDYSLEAPREPHHVLADSGRGEDAGDILRGSIIKIVCNEAVTAKKVDDPALEKFNMKPGAGGEDFSCVRGDGDSPDRSRGCACA